MKKIITISITLAITICVIFFFLMENNIDRKINLSKPTYFTVESGTSFNQFSKNLQKLGWIENRFWIRNYARVFPERAKLKSGTYQINTSETIRSLMKKVVDGKEHQFSITFIEGTTLNEWLLQIEKAPALDSKNNKLSLSEITKLLSIKEASAEGWLFPDTYSYTAGTNSIELFKRAHVKMRQILAELWENRNKNLPYSSPYQALIMASIVEKETSQLSEQPAIARVFINRIDKKMRLQTDPTVIYGLGERYKGNITKAHLREKTPYNTYRINGLPPTPIAMPSLSALQAVFYPDDNDYLYFVSKGNGFHQFSTNLADHNAAVRKYQLGNRTER